jgi:2-isopropylmalate synthase
VQAKTDAEGGEVSSDQLWHIFQDEYLPAADANNKWGRFELHGTRTESDFSGTVKLSVDLRDGDVVARQESEGNGPIDAFIKLMSTHGIEIELFDYVEHTLAAGGDARAAAYVELNVNGQRLWGVGIDSDISTATLKAVVSAINRAVRIESV